MNPDIIRVLAGLLKLALLPLLLTACAGGLQPVESPREMTPPPSQAGQWQELDKLRPGDWFRVLNTGSEALDWRLRSIDSALDSIDLQTFIWDLDGSGAVIRDHLLAAAARGVFVRVLVDDSFILDADPELLEIDEHTNIELKVFNPYKHRSSHAAMREVLNLGEFHRLDHRMHNKVMVIDNQVAVLGGRNLADHYFGYDTENNFRDMEVIAGGPIVEDLAEGFDRYWNNRWSFPVSAIIEQRKSPGSPEPVRLMDDLPPEAHEEQSAQQRQNDWRQLVSEAWPGTSQLLLDEPPADNPADSGQAPEQVGQALVERIDSAKSEVWLVSAYLIPTPELEEAVQRAEQRGVEVRILTNSINSNNHLTAHSAYRRHVRALVEMGADVFEVRADAEDRDLYIESPVENKALCLHAKILLFDDNLVYIGSANLDPRSFVINTEMGLLVDSPELNIALRQALAPDFSPRNAWRLELDADGKMTWISDRDVLRHQPTDSFMRRIEDWFLSHLPIEDEM